MTRDSESLDRDVGTQGKTWKHFVWDSLDKSPKERRFLLKLDLTLLTLGCLGFFTKYLNQANLTNAFVSGMKEDLDMFGNELNYATTAFTVGYIIGEVPSNILLTRIRPSIYIPSLQIAWTVLTFCLAAVTNTTQLYVLRFFIGLAEAGFYPGLQYMIGSWYRKDEMAKRACILNASGSIAMLFSGFLMTGVTNLSGRGGLPGWKWLFIMDGVISFPVMVASFLFLPDLPDSAASRRVFTEEEIELGKRRMALEERRQRAPFTFAKVKKVLSSWHIWLLSFYYIFISGTGGTPIFPQYLKYHENPKYTVQQINLYPSGVFAMQAFSAVVYAWISDTALKGRRYPILLFGAILNIITLGSLAVWYIPENWKWACYYLAGAHVGLSGIVFTWANEICTDDTEERAIVLATMNTMVGVMAAWLPLIVWQQVDAPQYHKGFITASCMGSVSFILIIVIKLLQDKETSKRRRGAIGPTADDASSESGTASADIKGNNGASQATPVDEKTE